MIMEEHGFAEKSENKHVNKQNNSDKQVFAVLGLLLAVALILVVGIVFVKLNNGGGGSSNSGNVTDVDGADDTTPTDELGISEGEGYYDALVKMSVQEYVTMMDKKIASAESSEEKGNLYLEMALDIHYIKADENELNQMSLDYLLRADELTPTPQVAWWISHYEDLLGNKDEAARYLQIAKDRGYVEVNGEG